MDGITLRVLGPGDEGVLAAVPEGLFDDPIRPDEARAFLADSASALVLAFDGALAVGMATGVVLRHPDKVPAFFVNEVGVRDGWLRRGIGQALCERLFAVARGRGCVGIWLGTEADNTAALALYRKLGGTEVTGSWFGWDGGI